MTKKFLKDEEGEDWDVGDTISIESTINQRTLFTETSSKETVDSAKITIEGYNSTIVNEADMSFNDPGEYYYFWDTSGLSSGDYKIIIESSEGNINEEEVYWIRLQ